MTVPGETFGEILEASERVHAEQRAIIETIVSEGRDPTAAELREFDRLTAEFLRLRAAVEIPPATRQ